MYHFERSVANSIVIAVVESKIGYTQAKESEFICNVDLASNYVLIHIFFSNVEYVMRVVTTLASDSNMCTLQKKLLIDTPIFIDAKNILVLDVLKPTLQNNHG